MKRKQGDEPITQKKQKDPISQQLDPPNPLVRFVEIWLMLMLMLICCERKTLFIR